MPERNNENATRTIEDVIKEILTGQMQQNALDYVAFLKANGMIPEEPEFYAPAHTQCFVGSIGILSIDDCPPDWGFCTRNWDQVFYRSEYQDFPADEKVKEFAWEHPGTCRNFKTNGKECGCGFQPGRHVTIFGKDIYYTCHGGLSFTNPDGEELELLKKLTMVLNHIIADAAINDKPYVPGENEWLPVKGNGAQTGRPLGKAYTKSLDVQFFITPRRRYAWDAAVGFSGGGWVPATRAQNPVGLNLSSNSRIEACKGPSEGWSAVETLKYQANVTYFAEMSINITDNAYSATVWMLDAGGKPDTPYLIAKDYPFRFGGESAIPAITAVDTIYLGQDDSHILAFTVSDFKVIGGE